MKLFNAICIIYFISIVLSTRTKTKTRAKLIPGYKGAASLLDYFDGLIMTEDITKSKKIQQFDNNSHISMNKFKNNYNYDVKVSDNQRNFWKLNRKLQNYEIDEENNYQSNRNSFQSHQNENYIKYKEDLLRLNRRFYSLNKLSNQPSTSLEGNNNLNYFKKQTLKKKLFQRNKPNYSSNVNNAKNAFSENERENILRQQDNKLSYNSKNKLQDNYDDDDLPDNTFFLEKIPRDKLSEMNYGDLTKLKKKYTNNFLQKKSRKLPLENIDSLKTKENNETSGGNIEKSDISTNDSREYDMKSLPSKIVLPKKSDLVVILEDWFKISSPSFKDYAVFPPISMPNGSQISLKVDHNNFRINDAFDEDKIDFNLPPERQYFWFRLSERNIFYSLSKTDLNILGAILFETVIDASYFPDSSNYSTCISILERENKRWKICAESIDIRNKWFCNIYDMLNKSDPICVIYDPYKPTVIEKVVTQPMILIPLPSRHCNDDWNYNQMGIDWECDCSEGNEQSPINLPLPKDAVPSPVKPLFQYDEALVKLSYSTIDGLIKKDDPLKILFQDNCLRIFHKYFGKIVTLDGAVYYAQEIVFHTPAEHTIDGKVYSMEMQVIHYGQSVGDISKQVILSFIFDKKPGSYNKFIDDIDFFSLPNPVSLKSELKNNLFIPKIFYSSSNNDIPTMKPFSFYTYQGSLTFPPCNERTIVYVVAKPIPLSSAAIQMFEEAIRIPDMKTESGDIIVSNQSTKNARKIQNLNERVVYYYESEKYCGPNPEIKPIEPEGHYEKIKKEMKEYFYVEGNKPSGLPGAYLVSKKEADFA